MMKHFKVSFDLADTEFLTAVRLVVGAICSVVNTDIDSAEDLKLCVTESCIILKNSGFESVGIDFSTSSDGVTVTVSGAGGSALQAGDYEFSLALVSALVSSCDIEKQGGVINKVILKI